MITQWPEAKPRWELDINGCSFRDLVSPHSLRRAVSWLLAAILANLASGLVAADDTVGFSAKADLAVSADRLKGRVELTLSSAQPIYGVAVYARGQGAKSLIGEVEYWERGERRSFDFETPSRHAHAGDYHLLVELAFRDQANANQGLAVALGYRIGEPQDTASAQAGAPESPSVSLRDDRVAWTLPETGISDVQLTLTTEPAWALSEPLTPPATRVQLEATGRRGAIPDWRYPQLARLDWVQNGRHFSRVQQWTIRTDASGNWQPASDAPTASWWRQATWLWILAALLGTASAALAWWRRGKEPRGQPRPRAIAWEEWVGGLTLVALTVWMIAHAAPSLWLARTWSTGGDVASQVFYAKIFMEWLPTGKISGWLPESFAGFPAFTFYFPFPFTLAGLLQFLAGQQVAFKLVSMLPAFLLPAATYALGWIWGWRVPQRLLAAAGAAGFILGDATSIWGGNVLAQLAGEFAYSWGLLFAVLFWGVLSIALRNGGRWWLLAGFVEALVALSHGYALLLAGFGAFLYLLVSQDFWRHLRIILQVHLLAFLLIGFWLMPLAENLPWTIPNDSATTVDSWQAMWPASLWPLALGWIVLLLLLTGRAGDLPPGIAFLLGIGILGLLGFFVGSRLGLADLRFFPYAQWALATASGAALGWGLRRWLGTAALPLAVAVVVALGAWWQPRLDRMEGWAHWNLAGYENNAMWPHYLATAQVNAGPLQGPRVVFEHDPANSDLGSTRTLEALPMFGSRPALEGLYMESATSGPFIYQLQAEISQRPSSPLNRFPASARSLADAVGHLNELYANRVILRSPEKKALFSADPRFRLVAEHGPLQTYELKELRTNLVDVLVTPIAASGREDWLHRSFLRFFLDHPYAERQVYLADGQQLPVPAGSKVDSASVEIREFSRERLVFVTDSPGQPHLIRMTYHPRWVSSGGEPIFLTEPSFMLIYPENTTVELRYDWSWGNWVGATFTATGFALLAGGLFPGSPLNPPRVKQALAFRHRRFFAFWVASSLLLPVSWWINPERIYQDGHIRFNAGDHAEAAESFDRAFRGRHGPVQKSEALFWAARSLQLAGELQGAEARYSQLKSDFIESYWYPESVFRLIEIHMQRGEQQAAESLYQDLAESVPDNDWTRKAAKLLGEAPSHRD